MQRKMLICNVFNQSWLLSKYVNAKPLLRHNSGGFRLFSAESQRVDNTGSGALCGGQPFGLQQAADLLLRVALVLLVPQHVQQRQPQAVELLRLRALQQTDQLGVVGLVVLGRAPGRSYHCKKWFAIGLAKPLANLGKE